MNRAMRTLIIVGGAVMSILLFLLASASENSSLFDEHYPWLLGLNAAVAGALLVLVIMMLARLYSRYRRGKFGSKLMARLVLMFAVMGILPGAVIYVVSVQFVSRSIESWFDVRVESALEAGVNLGRTALEGSLTELSDKARAMASDLSGLSITAQTSQLSRLRGQTQIQEAVIVSSSGQIIATSGGKLGALVPELPTSAMLRQARMTQHGFSGIEGEPDVHDGGVNSVMPPADGNAMRLRVVVAIPSAADALSLQSEMHFLQLMQPVAPALATNAEALRAAYSEYQTRYLARTGLRKIYIVTLTLTLLLAIFGAVASAFLIATKLARPLLLLAEGTRAVAGGDFSPRPIVASSDELSTLTQSFNTMTRQLYEARVAVEKNQAELEHAKAHLESVLANMSAGVMVLDGNFNLVTCNESVERILQHGFDGHVGKPLAGIEGLSPLASAVTSAFSAQSAHTASGGAAGEGMHWQRQIEIPRCIDGTENSSAITLLARGTRLPVKRGTGYIVVFDDISDVISAQRSIAWGEVARRLAHEIKNPLTPIQLSAERLQMKLEGKLTATDAAILYKSTTTIVNQVTSMKQMVNDFRDYAKTPPAVLTALDLNALIEEVLALYLNGDENDIIHSTLTPALPHVMGDATQLRQVIHNLLQNAQDAITDRAADAPAPRIDIITEVIRYESTDRDECSAIRLSIIDNGAGFPPQILMRAFEPYITSKPRGTGLGLAMVKKIIDEHGGRIDIQNRTSGSGAQVLILLLKLAPK